MTADELRALAAAIGETQYPAIRGATDEQRQQVAGYLRACASAMDAGPVAWAVRDMGPGIEHWVYVADYRDAAYQHIKDAAQTSELAVMSRTLKVAPLYQLAMPAPLRLPKPMTDDELTALWDAGVFTALRRTEAETLRRVREANK